MRLAEKKLSAALKKQGYRLTPQRRAVLNVVAASHSHLSPAEIYQRLHRDHPTVGVVTVYRTLEVLTSLGLLCQVHTGGSSRSYLLRRPAEHHHHLVCSGCGMVVDFTHCDLEELEGRLARETGFKVEEHLLECFGRCPDCRGSEGEGGKDES